MVKKTELYLTIFFVAVATIYYIHDVIIGNIQTTITTWATLVIASSINLTIVLMKKGKKDINTNLLLVSGTAGQIAILVSVVITDSKIDITKFDLLIFTVTIIAFLIFIWKRKNAIISAISINLAITISFIPLWIHTINGGNVESIPAWFCISIASVIGTISPIKKKNYLAAVYPLRSALTSVVVIALSSIY